MRKWLTRAPAGMPCWFLVGNMLPCRSGGYAPPSVFTQQVGAGPSSPGTTLRAWCALLPDDTAVGYVGTTTKLYHYDGATTFTDRSIGGGYTNTATDWSFAQYGNNTYATNRVDNIQVRDSTGSSAFADLGGTPPKARILVTQADQLLLFDLNDGAEKPDAYAACAPGDPTDWSGASATTATRIRHRPGKITAAVAFRDYVLVFKRSSVYRLYYTGNSTFKWKVELIAIGRGAFGKHDVVNCGDEVIFRGPGGAWRFDGASFKSISDWFDPTPAMTTAISGSFASYYRPGSARVYFAIADNITRYLVYNLVSDAWGLMAQTASDQIVTGYIPFTGEPAALETFEGANLFLGDRGLICKLSANPSVYDADSAWDTGSVVGHNAYLVSNLIGEGPRQIRTFTGITPVFVDPADYSSTAQVPPGQGDIDLAWHAFNTPFPGPSYSERVATGTASSATAARKFTFLASAAYLQVDIKIPHGDGHCEIGDVIVDSVPAGKI